MSIITYKNAEEVIVTTTKREDAAIRHLFLSDPGRDVEEYERIVHKEDFAVVVQPAMTRLTVI